MTFSNNPSVRNRRNNIYIDGIEIDTVNHTQFLGVITDNKISWSDHINTYVITFLVLEITCEQLLVNLVLYFQRKQQS